MNQSAATYAKYALYAFVGAFVVLLAVKFVVKATIAVVGFLLMLLVILGVSTAVLGFVAQRKVDR